MKNKIYKIIDGICPYNFAFKNESTNEIEVIDLSDILEIGSPQDSETDEDLEYLGYTKTDRGNYKTSDFNL